MQVPEVSATEQVKPNKIYFIKIKDFSNTSSNPPSEKALTDIYNEENRVSKINEIPYLNFRTRKPPLIERAKREIGSGLPYFSVKSTKSLSLSPTIESLKLGN